MIANGHHPGIILKEDHLKPLNMSVRELALALHVSASRMNELVRGRRAMSAEMALRLARYFNTSPEYWMNMQTAYDLTGVGAGKRSVINATIKPRSEK